MGVGVGVGVGISQETAGTHTGISVKWIKGLRRRSQLLQIFKNAFVNVAVHVVGQPGGVGK